MPYRFSISFVHIKVERPSLLIEMITSDGLYDADMGHCKALLKKMHRYVSAVPLNSSALPKAVICYNEKGHISIYNVCECVCVCR